MRVQLTTSARKRRLRNMKRTCERLGFELIFQSLWICDEVFTTKITRTEEGVNYMVILAEVMHGYL